jgi:hypothetical protein
MATVLQHALQAISKTQLHKVVSDALSSVQLVKDLTNVLLVFFHLNLYLVNTVIALETIISNPQLPLVFQLAL